MARKRVVTRKYNFPDSFLCTLCNKVNSFASRDILEFEAYGVDAAGITAFTAEIDSFEIFPTDKELLGKQEVSTEQKILAAEDLKTIIRNVMARVSTVFPEGSAKFEAFGTKGMSAMTDSALLRCGRRVARKSTQYLAQLSGTGMNAAIIAEIISKCQTYDDALSAQEDAASNREIATEDRTLLGNFIYDKLMKFSGFGQTIWFDKSEALYNDYIIYTKSGNLVKPIVMKIEKAATENIVKKLFAKENIFKITNTGKAKLLFGFCADDLTPVTAGVELAAGETKRVTAEELGDFAANNFLNCTNAGDEQGSFKIKLPQE